MDSIKLIDRIKLFGAAVLVIVVVGGAFLLADIHHTAPAWVFMGIASLGFFPAIGWDYRYKFHSLRFILFLIAWALIHGTVFVVVMSFYGWSYWFVAVFVELFFFYLTVDFLFGIQPPSRGNG